MGSHTIDDSNRDVHFRYHYYIDHRVAIRDLKAAAKTYNYDSLKEVILGCLKARLRTLGMGSMQNVRLSFFAI